ncbi:hypothetical protein PENTCL1PPCAC_1444, partial [Pristionchus entomophagus]
RGVECIHLPSTELSRIEGIEESKDLVCAVCIDDHHSSHYGGGSIFESEVQGHTSVSDSAHSFSVRFCDECGDAMHIHIQWPGTSTLPHSPHRLPS